MKPPRKPKPTLTVDQAWGFQGLMVTAAFRYCLGQQTYIVGCCVEWLLENWAQLPRNVQALIERELREEFARDDEARAAGDSFKPLGWDCDRKEWERVLQLLEGIETTARPAPAALGEDC